VFFVGVGIGIGIGVRVIAFRCCSIGCDKANHLFLFCFSLLFYFFRHYLAISYLKEKRKRRFWLYTRRSLPKSMGSFWD